MIVLAFDTSSRVVSVALCHDDHVLARRDAEAPPAEGLLGWVDEALTEAGITRDAIELVLPDGGVIEGRVVDARGFPRGGVPIELSTEREPWLAT